MTEQLELDRVLSPLATAATLASPFDLDGQHIETLGHQRPQALFNSPRDAPQLLLHARQTQSLLVRN